MLVAGLALLFVGLSGWSKMIAPGTATRALSSKASVYGVKASIKVAAQMVTPFVHRLLIELT